jgi:hypothetical protein
VTPGTGLVTLPEDVDPPNHKTRVAARWLEAAGWTRSILVRRNYGDLKLTPGDCVTTQSVTAAMPMRAGCPRTALPNDVANTGAKEKSLVTSSPVAGRMAK